MIGRLREGEIEGRVTVFSGKWAVTHFCHPEPFDSPLGYAWGSLRSASTKDPYRDQESNNPRLTNDKAFVTCTLDGFLAWLGRTNK